MSAHRGAVAAAALAGLLFGFDTAVISGVATPLAESFGLNEAEKGLAVSAALFGTLVAAMVAGMPGDRYGARAVLRWIGVAFLVSALGCALAEGLASFALFRFIGGLAIGGSSVLAPVFIAEISPAKRRGALVGLFQVSIVTGILAAYLSNALVAHLFVEDAWRWKLAVMIVPGAIFLAAMFVIPQSPRWLAARGRVEEGRTIAERLGIEEWATIEERAAAGEPAGARLEWRRHKKPILLAIGIASFNQLSGINPILYYLNDIFAAAGFGEVSADLQAVAIGATNLIATLFAMTLIDRVGRRTLLLIGAAGTALALAGVATVYSASGHEALLLPLLIGFIAFFAISQGAVIWVYLSEIFPTAVRARGQALGSATHWIWAAVLSLGFPVVAARYDQAAPFWIFAAAMVVQFFVVWRFFPETKQVLLEEMDEAIAPSGPAI
ncbi:MAG TPA: sugar porter family MFS transporter [Sphingomonas sp.]|nr:sugar porter family MFS transporter [Sphingomonas sp.]